MSEIKTIPAWTERYAHYYDLIHADHPYHDAALGVNRRVRDRFGTNSVRVLEVGCGTGVFAYYLVHHLAHGSTVLGYDPAVDMIEQARAKYKNASAFATEWPTDTFHVAVAHFNVLNYIQCPDETLHLIAGQLTENGFFLFDVLKAEDILRRGPDSFTRRTAHMRYAADVKLTPSDVSEHSMRLTYDISIFKDRQKVDEFRTVHDVYLHTLTSMCERLSDAGFDYVRIEPYGQGYLYQASKQP